MRPVTTLLCLLLLVTTGWATTIIKMDLAELVNESDNIVQGHIENLYAEWDTKLKVIFTYVAVRVDDPLKGDRRRSILIRQLGGRVGSMNMSVAGMPVFAPGEDVILFLKSNPEGTYHIVGLSQGKYEIAEDFAVANISGVELMDRKTGQLISGPIIFKEPLESFKSRIRSLLK